MYKPQRGLKMFLRALNVICFLITLATVIGSVVSLQRLLTPQLCTPSALHPLLLLLRAFAPHSQLLRSPCALQELIIVSWTDFEIFQN